MLKRFIISCLFVLFPLTSSAQITNVGVGYYGIQSDNWDCKASFDALRGVNHIQIAFLYKTFGLSTKCLDKFIADPRLRALEVHLTNGAGLRKAVPRWYELLAGNGYTTGSLNAALLAKDKQTLNLFINELKIVNDTILSKLDQGVACFVSPILEHDLEAQAFDNLVVALRKYLLPGCLIVDSPDGADEGATKPDILERHGAPANGCSNCINDIDGLDITFDFRKGISGAIKEENLPAFISEHSIDVENFLWIREFNGYGQASLNAANEDPRDRTNFPNTQLFQAVSYYINWAETQYNIPRLTAKLRRSFRGCSNPGDLKLPKGFYMFRNKHYGTTIQFPVKYMQPFESVRIFYNGRKINDLLADGSVTGHQQWSSEQLPYDLPYHSVIHIRNLNSSTDTCFYVKNPKKNIRG